MRVFIVIQDKEYSNLFKLCGKKHLKLVVHSTCESHVYELQLTCLSFKLTLLHGHPFRNGLPYHGEEHCVESIRGQLARQTSEEQTSESVLVYYSLSCLQVSHRLDRSLFVRFENSNGIRAHVRHE